MSAAASPIDHLGALDLAAAAPAFAPSGAEARDLRDHLRTCPDCARSVARMRADLAAIGRLDPAVSPRLHDRIREIAVTPPRSGPSAIGIVLVLALLAVGVVGVSIGVGAMWGTRPAVVPTPALPRLEGDAVDWRTPVVELAARQLAIDAGGHRFLGVARPDLVSDPGDPTRWTLEATWREQGVEQRLSLYFAADDASWWVDRIGVYDGDDSPKWATFGPPPDGAWMRTPLGETFSGDLNVEGASATGPVRLHLGGLRVAVHPQDTVAPPIGGVRKVLTENGNPSIDGDPFDRGGPLHCSGILLMPPQAAEARLQLEGYGLSWRWLTSTGTNMGTSEPRDHAPATGWITETAVGMNGELILFVANPASPPDAPAPTPPQDCAAP